MDLGYNDQLQLRTKGAHNITVPARNLPAGLGRNVQNVETRGFIGRLPELRIGDYTVQDLLVAYVSEEHSKNTISEAMIGLGLLSRFNLTFDYDRRKLYLEPTRRFHEAFEYNMTGMTLRRGDGDYLEVAGVYGDSPAEQIGLRPGDRILQINGRPAIDFIRSELEKVLSAEGQTVRFQFSRDGQLQVVSILLKRLV